MSELKLLSFDRFQERIKSLPRDYASHIRLIEEKDGVRTYDVPSFTTTDAHYIVKTELDESQTWYATCSCRGFRKGVEPTNPCRHVAGCILIDERFDSDSIPELEEHLEEIQDVEEKQEGKVIPTATMAELHKVVHPSGAGMLEMCSASQGRDEEEIILRTSGKAADMGSAIHKLLAYLIVKGAPPTDEEVKAVAAEYDVRHHEDEIRYLTMAGLNAWTGGSNPEKGLKRFFEGPPLVEEKLTMVMKRKHPETGQPVSVEFRGRADVLGYNFENQHSPQSVIVVDWKSGRLTDDTPRDRISESEDSEVTLQDVGHMAQMKATAMLAMARNSSIQKAIVVLVWLRPQEYSFYTFTRDELRDWVNRFIKYSLFWDGKTYTTGTHCAYCPRLLTCPAYARMTRNAIASCGEETGAAIELFREGQLVDVEQAARYIVALRQARKQLDTALDALKEQFMKIDPVPIPSKEGYVLGIQQLGGGVTIDVRKAWPVIKDVFTAEERAAFTSISTSTMKEVLYNKTERGAKKTAYNYLMSELKEAGAITDKQPRKSLAIFKNKEETDGC